MIELSNELEQKIESLKKEKKELEEKIVIVEKEKNYINNELSRLVYYYKKSKKIEKYLEKHKSLKNLKNLNLKSLKKKNLMKKKKIYGESY